MTPSRRSFVIGILNYNTKELLLQNIGKCLDSGIPPEQLLVLDNNSSDNSVQAVNQHYPNIRVVVSSQNLGYAGGMNRIVGISESDLAILVTADCFITRDTVDRLLSVLETGGKIMVVGCRVIDLRSGRIQSEGADITYPLGIPLSRNWQKGGDTPPSESISDVPYVGGSAMLVDVEKFREIGGFDESYFAYHEEVDLCWRARLRGYRVVCQGSAVASHVTYGSFGGLLGMRWSLTESNRIATNIKNLGVFHLFVALLYEAVYMLAVTVGSTMFRMPVYRTAYYRGLIFLFQRGRHLWAERKKTQGTRGRSDEEVLALHPRMGLLALIPPLSERLAILRSHDASGAATQERAY